MHFRKAKISDVEIIHGLITDYADKGLMLARPRAMLYEFLRDFAVAVEGDRVIAAGALHILWEDLAEIRALAVVSEYAGQGIGRGMVEYFLQEAKELGIPKIFTLTYQQGFFEKCGFNVIGKDLLPHKVWKECIDCPKFPNCEEIALVRNIIID